MESGATGLYDQAFYVDSRASGPSLWRYLHVFAAAFDPDDPVDVLGFLTEISKSFPCPVCRRHIALYIDKNPPATDSRESLVAYMNDMHNDVSRRLGKKTYTLKESIAETNKIAADAVAWSAKSARAVDLDETTELIIGSVVIGSVILAAAGIGYLIGRRK